MRRLTTALFARRDKVKDKDRDSRSDTPDDLSQSTHTTERTDHYPNGDPRTKHSKLASPILTRPKSRFFLTLVRKPLPAGGSSSSSSSVAPSTPEDDVAPAPAVYDTPTVLTTQDSDDDNDDDDDDDKPLTPAPPPPRTRIAQAQHMPAIAAPLLPPPTTTPALATATITSPPHMHAQQVVTQTTRSPPVSPAAYARALAQAALAPAFSAPPLLPVQHLPLFPRSVNPTRALATSPSHAPLLRQLAHRHVLARLSPERLSPADERCLAPFAGRSRRPDPKPSADAKLTLDSPATVSVRGVMPMSEGLRRWVMRPCFEDRFVVYVPSTDSVKCMSVSGTGLGVAALEYSEALEALAGLGEDDDQRFHAEDLYQNSTPAEDKKRQAQSGATLPFPRAEPGSSSAQTRAQTQDQAFPVWAALMGEELDTVLSPTLSVTTSSTSLASSGPPTPTSPPGGEPPSVLSGGKAAIGQQGSGTSPRVQTQPHKAQPSPLRIEQNMILPNPYSPVKSPSKSASDMPAPTPSPAPTNTSASTSTATITPATVTSQAPGKAPAPQKLGVRFAEDERPERNDNVPLGYVQRIKQKRLEKQRFLAEERARRAQEEQRRAERARMEEEQRKRMEKEKERREYEEERMRRMYAEELTAARNRREGMRFVPPTVAGVTPGGDYGGSRGRRESVGAGRGRETTRDESYKRPVYDERRQSEPTPVGARNGSPASSMHHLSVPGARNSSPAPSGSGSQKSSSHQSHSHSPLAPPPTLGQSARSSSAPDVRPRERSGSATTPQAQRASMAGDGRDRAASLSANPWMGGAPMNMGMAMGMPMGMNMNRMSMNMGMMNVSPMQMVVPMAVPVPVPVAAYGMPMGMEPLIPPTPPFVMQQFGYRPPSSQSKRSHEHSSQGQSQRRSHSSSPTPPRAPEPQSSHQQHQHQQQQQQSRSQSSSPSAKRAARETFPPSASKGAVRASQGQLAEQTSPSSRSPREYTQMRRSSVDGDLHRMSQVYPSIAAGGRSERELSRDRDERRSTRSSSAVPGRSSNHHSSMPTVPASHQSATSASRPTIVSEHNSWARPSSGFQILSRPSQSRRQTVIS
ncbi:uncharacterized protein LAESUDRAFT_753554 [Laetiporus sulphureus 93-53]|uniref:Uncharacterized protein n=1 Tax=Laetiporus sulphureus 93-53 TaxID=1314785 RepID=A0A165I1Q8_9APHY|nr:uncharacterized protein LAESUDRAFT_753554 [Laetiporus sulphureus 93-53]KZT12477.1 hypothetical protein LAESUDRAFT_753554 [Laetiporus sulphureus 93-53]